VNRTNRRLSDWAIDARSGRPRDIKLQPFVQRGAWRSTPSTATELFHIEIDKEAEKDGCRSAV
jgi:hypothetical protein